VVSSYLNNARGLCTGMSIGLLDNVGNDRKLVREWKTDKADKRGAGKYVPCVCSGAL
jgi:hypothetical protein